MRVRLLAIAVSSLIVIGMFTVMVRLSSQARRADAASRSTSAIARILDQTRNSSAPGPAPDWIVIEANSAHNAMVVEVEAQRLEEASRDRDPDRGSPALARIRRGSDLRAPSRRRRRRHRAANTVDAGRRLRRDGVLKPHVSRGWPPPAARAAWPVFATLPDAPADFRLADLRRRTPFFDAAGDCASVGVEGTTTGAESPSALRASTSKLRPASRSVTAPAAATFSMKSRKTARAIFTLGECRVELQQRALQQSELWRGPRDPTGPSARA